MKNTSCVIFEPIEKFLLGDVLLFKPLSLWVQGAVLDAGIEKVISSKECKERLSGQVFLVSGCCPLIESSLIESSFEAHTASGFKVTALLSREKEDICAAWVDADILDLSMLSLSSPEQVIRALDSAGEKTGAFVSDDETSLFTVNDARALYIANEAAKTTVINRAMEHGAVIMCDSGIIISPDSKIGAGSVILPGTEIRGHSIIGEGCTIGPNSVITDSSIGDGTVVNASQITLSSVGSGTTIGPFTQLRPDSHIGDNVKIGDFVEIKNSTIGDKTSVAHLTYVGDSDVGRKVNFGCGTVTVNYDGKNKFRSEIGDYAFIGCNTNIISPVKIGTNAFTAAGSTVTHDIPDDSLYVSRAREERIIDGWVEKKLGKRRFE